MTHHTLDCSLGSLLRVFVVWSIQVQPTVIGRSYVLHGCFPLSLCYVCPTITVISIIFLLEVPSYGGDPGAPLLGGLFLFPLDTDSWNGICVRE